MDEWDGPDLAPLAADIDHGASRSLFDRRRRRRRRGRIVGGGLAVTILVIGGVIGWASRADDDVPLATGGPTTVVSVETEPAAPSDPASGTAEVTVELVGDPQFHEGYDYAVRFRDSDGKIIEDRWLDEFEDLDADRPFTDYWRSVFELPSGVLTIESHLTTGIGPGPARPDFAKESGGPLCPPRRIEIKVDQPARLTLDWITGCLERTG